MITERAELEKSFSKALKGWSKRWSDYVTKCKLYICRIWFVYISFLASEFGSTASAWKAIMAEADASADVHLNVHDSLQNDVIPTIKTWQKGKYVKSMMHIKSTKEFDEEFRRVRYFEWILYFVFLCFLNRHKNHGLNYILKLTNINVNIMQQQKVLKQRKPMKIMLNLIILFHMIK